MSTNYTVRILLGIYTFLSQHLYNHMYIMINVHWSRSFRWKDISRLLLPFLFSYKWCICSLSKHEEYLLKTGHDSMLRRVKTRHTPSLRCTQFNVKQNLTQIIEIFTNLVPKFKREMWENDVEKMTFEWSLKSCFPSRIMDAFLLWVRRSCMCCLYIVQMHEVQKHNLWYDRVQST